MLGSVLVAGGRESPIRKTSSGITAFLVGSGSRFGSESDESGAKVRSIREETRARTKNITGDERPSCVIVHIPKKRTQREFSLDNITKA